MKNIKDPQWVRRIVCLLSLVLSLGSLVGCIRLTGTAGYTQVKNDEVVSKSTGFDLDSAKLVPVKS